MIIYFDELRPQWIRTTYEVDTDNEQEAIEQILEGDLECEESELLWDFSCCFNPLKVEILNEEGETIYERNYERENTEI